MIPLRQSTAAQEISLGQFLDSTDGDTEEAGLTIANTDIRIWKHGATTLANKNSGGATHISNGIYYCVLDATDTNTLGGLDIFVHVTGALAVKVECVVYPAHIFDSLIAGTDKLETDIVQLNNDVQSLVDLKDFVDTGYNPTSHKVQGVLLTDTVTTYTGNTLQTANNNVILAHASYGLAQLVRSTTPANALDVSTTGEAGIDFNNIRDAAGAHTLANITIPTCTTNSDMVAEAPTVTAIRQEMDVNSIKMAPSQTLNDYKATGFNTVVPDAAGTAATPAEVATALSNIHLDHLLAADYDPASKPGVATALLNELVENDGGTSRYTANALEQAPSAGTNPNVLINTTIATVTDQTHIILTAGSNNNDAYKDQAIVIYDASNSNFPSVRVVSGYVGSTLGVTLDSAPDFTMVPGDGSRVFVTAPGTSAPTVGQIRIEMDTNSTKMAPSQTLNDYKATGFNTVVPDAAGTLATYDPATRTEATADKDEILADLLTMKQTAVGTYNQDTDSLEAIRNRGDAGWTTGAGGSAPTVGEIRTEMEGAGTKLTLVLEDTDNLQTNQGAWATATTTALSVQGKLDVNAECDTALTDYGANTTTPPTVTQIRQEMDINSTKMAPSQTLNDYKATGFNTVTPDIAGTAAVLHGITDGKVDDVSGRLPAALIGGRMNSDVVAISGSTDAADKLEASAETIILGAANTGTLSTTEMTTNLSISVTDQYNGRQLVFKEDTATAALRGQATDITATVITGGKLTFTAITTAPSPGDFFNIV